MFGLSRSCVSLGFSSAFAFNLSDCYMGAELTCPAAERWIGPDSRAINQPPPQAVRALTGCWKQAEQQTLHLHLLSRSASPDWKSYGNYILALKTSRSSRLAPSPPCLFLSSSSLWFACYCQNQQAPRCASHKFIPTATSLHKLLHSPASFISSASADLLSLGFHLHFHV